MPTDDQLEYFRSRAAVERQLAEEAGATIEAQIHRELARRYEDAVAEIEKVKKLKIVV